MVKISFYGGPLDGAIQEHPFVPRTMGLDVVVNEDDGKKIATKERHVWIVTPTGRGQALAVYVGVK